MFKHTLVISALALFLTFSSTLTLAADQKQVYGSQLMTQQERIEFREKLRNAKTVQEREQIRNEHHKKMQKRAKKLGLSLPDKPPSSGKGMGPRGGMGGGRGFGDGSGGGR